MSTETMAVDREQAVKVLHTGSRHEHEGDYSRCGFCAEWVDKLIASGILRDVHEVQHEHGERIAKAIEADVPDAMGLHRAARTAYVRGIAIARDFSPPP